MTKIEELLREDIRKNRNPIHIRAASTGKKNQWGDDIIMLHCEYYFDVPADDLDEIHKDEIRDWLLKEI